MSHVRRGGITNLTHAHQALKIGTSLILVIQAFFKSLGWSPDRINRNDLNHRRSAAMKERRARILEAAGPSQHTIRDII